MAHGMRAFSEHLIMRSVKFIPVILLAALLSGAQTPDAVGSPAASPERIGSLELRYPAEAEAANAQRSSPAKEAVSYSSRALTEDAADVTLPPVDVAALLAEDRANAGFRKRLRVGVVRELDASPAGSGEWETTPDGSRAHHLVVESQGAVGLRLHLVEMELPQGASLYVYGAGGEAAVYRAGGESREVWSPLVEGSRAELILVMPAEAEAPSRTAYRVDSLSHFYKDISKSASQFGEGTCNIDVSCSTEWDYKTKSVARITFVSGGTSYLCSGTLINNATNDYSPAVITANHCISTDVEAQSAQFFWLYKTATCDGAFPSTGTVPRSNGARLVATAENTDFTLLEVLGLVPNGLNYSGWDRTTGRTGNITGVHHPFGAYMRISHGRILSTNPSEVEVQWSQGTTEGGSSGSGLFLPNGDLIGQLSGGYAACENPLGADYYGNFSTSAALVDTFLTSGFGDDTLEPDNLREQALTPDPSGFNHSQRVVRAGNDDWYRFFLRHGSRLSVTLNSFNYHGQINMTIYRGGAVDPVYQDYTDTAGAVNEGLDENYYLRVRVVDDVRNTYSISGNVTHLAGAKYYLRNGMEMGRTLEGFDLSRNVRIVSSGNTPLTVDSITVVGQNPDTDQFTVSHDCNSAMPTGSGCNLRITMLAAIPGNKVGFVTIRSNGNEGPYGQIFLSGSVGDIVLSLTRASRPARPGAAEIAPGTSAAFAVNLGVEAALAALVTITCEASRGLRCAMSGAGSERQLRVTAVRGGMRLFGRGRSGSVRVKAQAGSQVKWMDVPVTVRR